VQNAPFLDEHEGIVNRLEGGEHQVRFDLANTIGRYVPGHIHGERLLLTRAGIAGSSRRETPDGHGQIAFEIAAFFPSWEGDQSGISANEPRYLIGKIVRGQARAA